MTIFNPLDLMARPRAREGFKDPAYRAGLALIYKSIGVPVPDPNVPSLDGALVMLAGMEHIVGVEQIAAARAIAGDDPATIADAVALLRAGWRVESGRWTSPVNNDAAALAFGVMGAVVNALKPKNRRDRRAAKARSRH